MKKALCLVLSLILILSASGCTGILGGTHSRELGRSASFLSDGEKKYLRYSIGLQHGYVEFGEDTIKLCDDGFEDTSLSEVEKNIEVVVFACATALGSYFQEEYEYLEEEIAEKFNGCENYEIVVLKSGDKTYGAINCYNRSSGRSGNVLSNEDLDASYLFNLENEKIEITHQLDKTAVLALNDSHYIAYSDMVVYSADKESGAMIEICKDIWWDIGPTFYSYFNVYFVDDAFMICGNRETMDEAFLTLIVGDINGERIEVLISDEKAEY